MAFATFRVFRRHRSEDLLSVVALTAGIGFCTTLFSVVLSLSFTEPPLSGSRQVIRVQSFPADTDTVAQQQTTCEAVAGVVTTGANITAGDVEERVRAAWVSPVPGAGLHSPDSVLLSDTFWRQRFSADPSVAGKTLLLNGELRTVTGVLPAGFAFPRAEQVWAAWDFTPAHLIVAQERGSDSFIPGRLKPGRTVDHSRSEMNLILNRLSKARTHEPAHNVTDVVRYSDMNAKGDVKILMATVLCACFCVLLIACADVAHLQLARASRRMTEFALRSALGASRRQIVIGLLKESLLLSAAGAAGGIVFSVFALRLFRSAIEREALLTQSNRPWVTFELDGWVLLFVVVLTLVAGIAAGLIPALRVSRMDLDRLLRDSGGITSLRAGRFGRLLVHVQLAGARRRNCRL
jgi:hypothetical protein